VRPLRRGLQPAVATLAGLGILLSGCGSSGTPSATIGAYVALGDSYSSGAGIAPVRNAACSRSGRNYASLVAERMHAASFIDATCGGAMTTDLTGVQAHTGNAPQLDSLDRRTRLVTLTIGLNDDNLSYDLLFACVAASGTIPAPCAQVLAVPQGTVDSVVLKVAGRVAAALRLIHERAPRARVVLVGYPRILPDSGDCPDRLPLAPAMEPRLRAVMKQIDDGWRRAAAAVGVDYVDTWAMSRGHDVCSSDPWVNGASDAAGEAAPLHPFPAFHRAVADAIVELLEKR
jgi:lysophospholipase L1-like esterase